MWSNVIFCVLMVTAAVVDLCIGANQEAMFCAIVAAFTGFNAWIEFAYRR